MRTDGRLSRRQFLQAVTYGGVAIGVGGPRVAWRSRQASGTAEGVLPGGGPAAVAAAGPVVPEIVWQADPHVRAIALTIDDWFDREMVALALDIAAEESVQLTFFPIGRTVRPNADLIRRAARDGHEIENHTWDHQRLDLGHCPIARIPGEIDQQFRAIRAILGPSYRQQFLRPPGGFGVIGGVNPYLVRAATAAGLRIAMWNVDSQGWRSGRRADPAAVNSTLSRVVPGLTPGAIVLQHAIPADVLGLRAAIRVARDRGLRMVTLAELVGLVQPAPAVPCPLLPGQRE
jgi:peptidoglycan/xylan/chitin deacetylase (PgdA/CDA1 family)